MPFFPPSLPKLPFQHLLQDLPPPAELLKKPLYHAALPLRKMPFNMQALLLQKILGRVLAPAIEAGDFDSLINRRVKITVVDSGLSWCLGLGPQRDIRITQSDLADTEIRANTLDFLHIANHQKDPDTLFFQRRLVILGDTALGHEVKNLLDAIDPAALPPIARQALLQMAEGLTRMETFRSSLLNALQYQEPLLR
jgi:predicted lipid carrier protein YhbT